LDDERLALSELPDDGAPAETAKDPAEQEALARDLGEELTDLFARYVRGEIEFADLSFLTYETLQDLFVIASGAYELEYDADDEDGDDTGGYDDAEATEQQEDLSQEPAER
jgi:hypothetical protein